MTITPPDRMEKSVFLQIGIWYSKQVILLPIQPEGLTIHQHFRAPRIGL